jgi:FdhE protein
LPPFAADSLVREDAWLAYLHALLQRYVAPEQPAVVDAATLRAPAPASCKRGRWRWSAVSTRWCRRQWCRFSAPAASVEPLVADAPNLQLKPGDSLSQCPACGSPDGRGDSPSRQAQRPALSGVLAVRL